MFLDQFGELWNNSSVGEMLNLLKNNCSGFLYQWISGLELENSESTKDLRDMIIEIFSEEEEQGTTRKCMSIIHRGFCSGKLVDDICFLFGNKKKISMSREEIIDIG